MPDPDVRLHPHPASSTTSVNLELSTCTLRSLRADDAQNIAHHANNRAIWRNLKDRFPHPYALNDAESYLDAVLSRDEEMSFAIDVQGQAVGVIGFENHGDIWRRAAEIGYWLGEPFWGRGILSEAVRVSTDWAFAQWDINRVWAGVFEWNPASVRVLEKAGFTFEARLRKSAVKDGVTVDELIYAIVRDQIPAAGA